jgi:hypothetical protein
MGYRVTILYSAVITPTDHLTVFDEHRANRKSALVITLLRKSQSLLQELSVIREHFLSRSPPRFVVSACLEQPGDAPVFGQFDIVGGGDAREAGHRHDLAAHRDDELGPGR